MEDRSIILIVTICAFAVVAVVCFFVFKGRAKVRIKGPLGTSLDLNGSNPDAPLPPGVSISDAVSRAGGLNARDTSGRGVNVQRVDVKNDIVASSGPAPENPGPKQ